jgi:hypothetical protein
MRWARGGRAHRQTDLTAHAGSKVHLAALQHVATRLGSQGIVASMGQAVVATHSGQTGLKVREPSRKKNWSVFSV